MNKTKRTAMIRTKTAPTTEKIIIYGGPFVTLLAVSFCSPFIIVELLKSGIIVLQYRQLTADALLLGLAPSAL